MKPQLCFFLKKPSLVNDVYRYKQKRNIISSDNGDNKGLLDSLKLLFDNYTRGKCNVCKHIVESFLTCTGMCFC